MAGNSQRRGAMRKDGTKKGMVVGSGGQRRKQLQGKGPTPPKEERPNHPAARRAKLAERSAANRGRPGGGANRRRAGDGETPETVLGRNPVVECLRAGVPATALQVAIGTTTDDRVREAVSLAADMGISILEVAKTDLDKMSGGALHQGLALQVPPYAYAHPDELLEIAGDSGDPALIVALDGVTDPRNLGAVVRSVGAFGGHGVVVPQRRAAGMTAVAWRTSAGTAARVPVARATNLTRTLQEYASAGLMIAGLAADGDVTLDEFELATDPVVIVIGSEGKGLGRLVKQTCDVTVSIPMAGPVESLNASVAAGVVLAEISRQRRARLR
ncbi:23S rRNA (guanosine(2251)-2'-O)-methyltransferase RlmB [Pseudonocardia sp. KRD-184]|uniref:23S rRNA (Guanosine(2251)-2'-O)-methyltransferase RlmB n=1 Tax=Pseudonocardia oceani TaxID=2792013 RepID=A0ABS6UAS2_9PSEU|nr:23S rRNA (guanosine(2251)-2'-O)-methyltransferase RlmB [Pseudonocardia oceani]MBW0090546.1 23S rRNA (guanosine(2251)-2'-O)-methyltransferase RlmB [Pseudonocardia oceani]MBW0097713.1 23S rRNA (guanosine(2251)-2'-O)-methyltransferase RlmB [Pseudonocardia oceani]MBW0110291.1 23S rRNA (guanosine(2251)-2'-O)-methyltransferase RlmB [Pseudonocardia oceani]MBW0124405.1 23S rRNA (guanosine(2251)-2'-O)-methyltransferase RlmB [Pseudonocardia oceani]MBW0129259.1 23S rRNA (guanosine(2251)-2'-O)-methyltr